MNDANTDNIVRRGVDFLWCIYEGNENTAIFDAKKMLNLFFNRGKQAMLMPAQKEELTILIVREYAGKIFKR